MPVLPRALARLKEYCLFGGLMMQQMSFRIKGMDCGDEVAAIKSTLAGIVGPEEHLLFDLINNKLTVLVPKEHSTAEVEIRKAIAQTGMEAIPWTEACASGVCGIEEGFWSHRGRLVMCVLSGLLLGAAFLWQTVGHESPLSISSEGSGKGHALPLEVVVFYVGAILTGAWFVVPKAVFSLRKLRPDMNLLMTLAVIGAMWIGEWFEAASVTFLFSLALLLETWSVGHARKAIKNLMDLTPTKARCICPVDGDIEEKAVEEVPVGTVLLVRPGERIPLDGFIAKGQTSVNQAPITGESMPVFKKEGDEVFAGTINGEGAIEFKSTRVVSDTTLGRIIRMVEEAQSRRAPSEQWVEKFSRFYTPLMLVLALSIAVFAPILLGGDWEKWFYQALVILVIACPCALVISTPVSIVAGITSAVRNGVLIKGGVFLEAAAHLKAVALDKTGTVTYGQPNVLGIIPLNGHTADEVLARAAALESHSTHPLARAILKEAAARNMTLPSVQDYTITPGLGAEATIEGKPYWIGSHRMLIEKGLNSYQVERFAAELQETGQSLVALGCEKHVCGIIGVADALRAEAKQVVASLKQLGISKVAMLTGDNQQAAKSVATSIGVDEVWAELLPQDKVRVVGELTKEYGEVAVVGDGVNDAPAMAAARLGIAMGAMGTDAAIETADIVLMSDDLLRLPWLVGHARRTLRIIKENIAFALGLKLVFIVLALTGMATLWLAIAADMGGSLLVIFNSLRLLNGKGA